MIKNILILDTGKEWGGGTNSLLALLKRIDRTNFKFTALFYDNYEMPGKSDIKTEIEKLGVDFILLKRRPLPSAVKILKELSRVSFFFSRKLRKLSVFRLEYFFRIKKDADDIEKLINKLEIALIYMNNQPSTNLEGIMAAHNAGIRSLLHSRIETDLNSFEVNTVNKWLTKMICVSEGVKDYFIRQGVEPSKCVVVHNGIDISTTPAISPDKIREEFGIKEDEVVIAAVGSLVKRKRFNDLIKAISYIRGQGSGVRGQIKTEETGGQVDMTRSQGSRGKGQGLGSKANKIKCIIVGEGPERDRLQKEIEKNNLNGVIILAGFKADAISYINAMDILVLPSEREGLPRVILEAMLMGKPVVASRIAGPAELVVDEQTGFLFKTGSIKELGSHISNLISSPALRKNMGEAGRKRVTENFSIGKYVDAVEKILAEVAG
ncbi:MAG: glycosyltransferase family 4 protein [Nitrospirae bacterium]|nr:glycosyltransferase family 4 protein [Nitrospirota bacterium]